MKSNQTILIGSPLLGREAAFLRTLCADLAGLNVLIIANFVVRSSRQIDFLVVTPTNAVLIELKNYRFPVFGQMNGVWSVSDAAGNATPDPRFNPWAQTLEESYALSDELKRDQSRKRTAPQPNGGYYKLFRAFVCFYPEIV
ncbi:MAG TPA: nuclease-related domain-containing protein, partial [Candidatus Elarobacter sp.]